MRSLQDSTRQSQTTNYEPLATDSFSYLRTKLSVVRETTKVEHQVTDGYASLLHQVVEPELFVRRALALLESDFREAALVALADWERLGLVSPELFDAIASLQRPSWGTWNGLLAALKNARRAILRTRGPEEREKVERAAVLNQLLALLNERLTPDLTNAIKPLGKITNSTEQIGTAKVGNLLTLPITLRNRVAHDAPGDPAWWDCAAQALLPVIEFIHREKLFHSLRQVSDFPLPWFAQEGEELLSFNGINVDFAAVYISKSGRTSFSQARGQEVLLAFQRLLGKQEVQAKDFRKLLGRLAPEEIKGVLMGDFLVGRPVGVGGFGTVHVGRQLSTGRKVAIKILHDGMPADARARFQQEASYLSKFDHPNIVGVIGYGEETWSAPRNFSLAEEGWFREFSKTAPVKHYIAIEWIEGKTLEEIYQSYKEQRPETRTLAEWFAQSSGALSAVHAMGLIHRDVKPNNLMLDGNGVIKLMDFGIARTQDETRTILTSTGIELGTPAYMSPEQIRAGIDAEAQVGPATDIYSLCATFYELFTGARLFHHDTASTEQVRMLKLRGEAPERPQRYTKNLPWELETILLGGLQAEVSDRYESMSALERDLQHFLRDEAIEYRRPSIARVLQLGYRRHRTVANLLMLFLLLAVAGVFLYVRSIRQEQQNTLRQLFALYEEQGRQELLKGNSQVAVLYLSEAYRKGDTSFSLRFLLGQAMRPVDAMAFSLEGHAGGVHCASFSHDGKLIVTGGEDKTVKVWNASDGKLLRTLEGYEYAATTAYFSDDDQRILTADKYGKVKIWETTDGQLLASPQTQFLTEISSPYAFSPDGQRLVAAGSYRPPETRNANGVQFLGETKASIRDAASAKRLANLGDGKETGVFRELWFVVYSPDGKVIATGEGDYNKEEGDYGVKLWDAESGNFLAATEGKDQHTKPLTSVAFSPDSRLFVTTSRDGTAKLFNFAERTELATLKGHEFEVTDAAFSPDGTRIVTASADNTARVWKVPSGELLFTLKGHTDRLTTARFSPDGKLIATLGAVRDRSVKIWDAASAQPLITLGGHAANIESFTFSPNSQLLITISEDGTAKVWNIARDRLQTVLEREKDEYVDPKYSPDGKYILVNHWDGTARVLDAETRKELFRWSGNIWELDAAFTPDSKRLLILDKSSTFHLLELPSGKTLSEFQFPSGVAYFTLSPDGQRVLVSDSVQEGAAYDPEVYKTAQVWEVASRKLLLTLKGTYERLGRGLYSPDGQIIAFPDGWTEIRLWEASSGKPLGFIHPKKSDSETYVVHTMLFSPDSKLIAVTADNVPKIFIYEAKTGKQVLTLEGHMLGVENIQWTYDSKCLITTSRDRTAKVWDVASGSLLMSLEGHTQVIQILALSPDDQLIATADYNGVIKIWEAQSGKLLTSLDGHTDQFRSMEFSPDARHLLISNNDKTARIWDVRLEERSPDEIVKAVNNSVPFRLDGGRIVPKMVSNNPAK